MNFLQVSKISCSCSYAQKELIAILGLPNNVITCYFCTKKHEKNCFFSPHFSFDCMLNFFYIEVEMEGGIEEGIEGQKERRID